MAGRGGNYNPGGRNAYSPRQPGSLVNIRFDFAGMAKLAARRAGEAKRADPAILEVHHYFAELVQHYVADELRRSIKAHGRAQRPEQALMKALLDPRNRKANLHGFTVGYLDEPWAGEVRKYWRGLEYGTAVHVGRFLRGSFQNTSGRLVRPIEGGKDPRFLQFGPIGPARRDGSFVTEANRRNQLHKGDQEGPRMADARFRSKGVGGQGQIMGVRIKNPIAGYHYFKRGKEAWSKDFDPEARMEMYIQYFDWHHIDFLARALSRGLSGTGSLGGKGLTIKPPKGM